MRIKKKPSPDICIVIPARQGSVRFPNKPLAMVLGQSVLYRTWSIAKNVLDENQIWIATDSEDIAKHAKSFGAQTFFIKGDYDNGTLRVAAAIAQLGLTPHHVINFQSDAILTPPWVLQQLVDRLSYDPHLSIVTPAVLLNPDQIDLFKQSKMANRVSGTLVVFDKKYHALYFSKGFIPHIRTPTSLLPVYRHIGMYGMRLDILQKWSTLPPTPLEQVEQLEQLRPLEHGIPIDIECVDYQGRSHWSIDNPEDIAIAEKIIQQEGELVL